MIVVPPQSCCAKDYAVVHLVSVIWFPVHPGFVFFVSAQVPCHRVFVSLDSFLGLTGFATIGSSFLPWLRLSAQYFSSPPELRSSVLVPTSQWIHRRVLISWLWVPAHSSASQFPLFLGLLRGFGTLFVPAVELLHKLQFSPALIFGFGARSLSSIALLPGLGFSPLPVFSGEASVKDFLFLIHFFVCCRVCCR
jgi:hypothetical protein